MLNDYEKALVKMGSIDTVNLHTFTNPVWRLR